ncbi:unnamed protein product [Phytophthora lilii]|uniref:Unnamed protein product n=1 Tax=Phytophthora lilii TaxID=2077276 RepID=A0A9W6YH29_9STRA|nr:unnamed protein product [Phytophthora lilii]
MEELDAKKVEVAATETPVTGQKRARAEEQPTDAADDEEEVVTLSEVLRHNEQLTDTADAVLGDASDTHCSYPMGYLRQAVETDVVGADAGNPCKLEAGKAKTNPRNTYSQNYGGLYCNCHRPYPDPERTTTEVMVQCVICEDWLHEEHISRDVEDVEKPANPDEAAPEAEKGSAEAASSEDAEANKEALGEDADADADAATDSGNTVSPESFDELICLECMKKHPFLMAYTVESPDADENDGAEGGEGSSKEAQPAANECVLKVKQKQLEAEGSTALRPTFWSSEWRSELCQCSSCVSLFEKHGIAFLLDPEDALHVYEASAREKKTASDEEIAQRAFANKLTHEQQVEVAMGYSLMKNNLQQYLAGFAAAGKTVRAEDIKSFFDGMNQANRQKTE